MQAKEKFEIALIRKSKQIVLSYFGKALFLVFFSALGVIMHHKLFPRFKAVSVLHVKTQQDSSLQNIVGRASGMQFNPYSVEAPSAKYIKILKSDGFYSFVEQQVKLRTSDDSEIKFLLDSYNIQKTGNWETELAGNVFNSSSFKGNDDFIEIYSYGTTLDRIVSSSRFMMDISMKYITIYERKEIEDAEVYLKTQQAEIQKRIDQMNEAIESLKGEKYLYDIGSTGGNFLVKSFQNLKEEEQTAKFKIEEVSRNIRQLVVQIKNEDMPDLSRNYESEELNRDAIYKIIQNSRGRLPDKIRLLLDEHQQLLNRKEAISSRIVKVLKSLNPKAEQKLLEIKRKIEVENSFYLQLQKQIFENRIYQISIDNRVRPYEVANYLNTGRETQLLYKLFVTAIFVIIVFILFIVLYEKMFPTVTHRDDLAILGIKPLGDVPDMRTKTFGIRSLINFRKKEKSQAKIHNPFVRSQASMSFQNICTRVLQALLKITKSKSGVVSILSQSSGDGKSVIAANAASYFAAYGFRTLLVHADWLKSQSNHFFTEYSNNVGLSDYLANKVESVQDIINPTKITNLSVINSGSFYHSFEMFKESKYKKMIEELRNQYELIFIDTPALGAGIEGFELTSVADLNIVVMRAYKTEIDKIRELVENLRSHGCDNIYGILNDVDSNSYIEGHYKSAYTAQSGGRSA